MSSSSTPKIPTPVVVNTDDLTLDELDRSNRLVQNGDAGNVTALAYVWLKREHPATRLADVKKLRNRDVEITNDAELAEQDGGDATASDPTN